MAEVSTRTEVYQPGMTTVDAQGGKVVTLAKKAGNTYLVIPREYRDHVTNKVFLGKLFDAIDRGEIDITMFYEEAVL